MKDTKGIMGKSSPNFLENSCNCLNFKDISRQTGLGELPSGERTPSVGPALHISTCNHTDAMWLQSEEEQKQWFVMRDLKRPNAKLPAYKQLRKEHIEVFTPMKWHLTVKQGKKIREEIPFIQDLLFVHATRKNLDLVVEKTPTLQYRYMRGRAYREPMTTSETEMRQFILAVSTTESPCYYLPEEITKKMYGRKVRIVGGPLNGYEGRLLTTRGSKIKRLLVEIPGLLSVSVEVSPEFIELL